MCFVATDYWCGLFRTAGFTEAEANRIGIINNEWAYNGEGTKVRMGSFDQKCDKGSNAGSFHCAGNDKHGHGRDQAAAVKLAVDNNGLYPGTAAAGRGRCSMGKSP